MQESPYNLDSVKFIRHRVNIEFYFDIVVDTGGHGSDLQKLSMLIDLQEHALDAVEAWTGDGRKGAWDLGTRTDLGLEEVLYDVVLDAGTFEKQAVEPFEEELLIGWDGRVSHEQVPYLVYLLLGDESNAKAH